MNCYTGIDAKPFLAKAQNLLWTNPVQSVSRVMHLVDMFGCQRAEAHDSVFVIAVDSSDDSVIGCVTLRPIVDRIHTKSYRVEMFVVSTKHVNMSTLPPENIADRLLDISIGWLPRNGVLVASCTGNHKGMFDNKGFRESHRLIHRQRPCSAVMLYSTTPLQQESIQSLRRLDSRNKEKVPVIFECETRLCHEYGSFICPGVGFAIDDIT